MNVNHHIQLKKIEHQKKTLAIKIHNQNKEKEIVKQAKLSEPKKRQETLNSVKETKKIVNKPDKKITDICTILEKCSIDEISKYLVKQGKAKKFPDIAIRENK